MATRGAARRMERATAVLVRRRPLSWARLLAGGVGVCELPARRRRDEAIEARVSRPPVGTVSRRRRAVFVRTRALPTPIGAVGQDVQSRLRVPPGFDAEISSSFSSAYPSLLFLPLAPVTNTAFSIPTSLSPPCFPLANLCVQICELQLFPHFSS